MSFAPTIPDLFSQAHRSMQSASGRAMGKSHGIIAQPRDSERTVVQERTNEFLRRIHPLKTAENVAADTGISPNTIAKWLERGSAPTSWAFLKLLSAYGPELACAVMTDPPSWLDRAAREEERRRLEGQIAALQARLDGRSA